MDGRQEMTREPAMTDAPTAIAHLPVNKAGYPVPWFVDRTLDTADGEPDFRVADSRKLRDAIRFRLCWVCGKQRGRYGSFVVGPMCAINRTNAEPPCHRDCAVYSATHCPFLTRPSMVRRDKHLPDARIDPAGVMILRNPGVALVYTARNFRPYPVDNGVLWDMGAYTELQWFAEGREATVAEILASIESGIPALLEIAQAEGPDAVTDLTNRRLVLEAEIRRRPETAVL
jgi:hypothetical protein